MRIAVIHSFYRSGQPSGENIAVEQQVGALERAGIEIVRVFRYTDVESKKPLYSVRSAWRMATGLDSQAVLDSVASSRVVLVHVHNLTPNFGDRWVNTLQVPLVTTVHNFRHACANGLLFRDGKICLECPENNSLFAVKHRCYQRSALASIPAAIATRGGPVRNRVLSHSALVITQSTRVQSFMLNEGVAEQKLLMIPGFVEPPTSASATPPDSPRFVFVGRDTPEKGLRELVAEWPNEWPLDVIGTEGWAGSEVWGNVTFRGRVNRDEIRATLSNYTALVFPGLSWEGAYPLAVREALAAGLPVVARAGSGAADLVTASRAGVVFASTAEGPLRDALREVVQSEGRLRARAQRYYEGALTEERWVTSTLQALRSVLTG